MQGTVVQANNLDSVRIEVLGEGRAVTIPCGLILAMDRLLRGALMHEEDVFIEQDDDRACWILTAGNMGFGESTSPWAAVNDWNERNPQ